MNTQDKIYSAYIKLESTIKVMIKAENFDEAVAKIKTEYPNGEITYINLEANVNLI